MIKITITQIGTPKTIQTKYGPKEKSYIKAAEYGDNYLSYWLSPVTKEWKEGQIVEVLDVTSREYQGKTYYDISMPKANGGNNTEVLKQTEKILHYLVRQDLMLKELLEWKRLQEGLKPKITGTDIDYPTAEEEGIDGDGVVFDEDDKPPFEN